jgi:hypothetical protein
MNIFKLLFELFLAYLAYKLLFEFIIPVYRTTKQVRQKMSEMQEKMQQQQNARGQRPPEAVKPTTSQASSGDYIDYEEIK